MQVNKLMLFFNSRGAKNIFWILFLGVFFWIYVIPIKTATNDRRMVAAFDSDEAMCLEIIKEAVTENRQVQQKIYGDAYFNLAHSTLLYLYPSSEITHQHIIICLRAVSCFFALLSLCTIFGIAMALTQHFWFSVGVVFSIFFGYYDFFFNATNAHPDSMQLSLLLGALFFIIQAFQLKKRRYFIMSFFLSGLAFSTKFFGVFMLPVLLIAIIGYVSDSKNNSYSFLFELLFWISIYYLIQYTDPIFIQKYISTDSLQKTEIVKMFGVIHRLIYLVLFLKLTVFFPFLFIKYKIVFKKILNAFNILISGLFLFSIAFFFTSPELSKNYSFLFLILNFEEETGYKISQGHWFSGEFGILHWLKLMSGHSIGHWMLILFFVLHSFLILYYLIKDKKMTLDWILWIWCSLNMLYVFFTVRAGFEHYLLTFMPVFWIFSLVFIFKAWQYFPKSAYVSFLLLVHILSQNISEFFSKRSVFLSREETSVIKGGDWLLQNISLDKKIMADYYAYVPWDFQNYKECWGMDSLMVAVEQPDVIIITRISARFSSKEKSEQFLRGKSEDFLNKHYFYENLKKGNLPYVKAITFEDIDIYIKK